MKAFDRVVTTFGILLVLSFRADAHDPSMAHHEWFNDAGNEPGCAGSPRCSLEILLRQRRRIQDPFQGW